LAFPNWIDDLEKQLFETFHRSKAQLPIVVCLSLGNKCAHAVCFVYLPDATIWYRIFVDSSKASDVDIECMQLRKKVEKVLDSVWRSYSETNNEKLIVVTCSDNIQSYGTCASWSLGFIIHLLYNYHIMIKEQFLDPEKIRLWCKGFSFVAKKDPEKFMNIITDTVLLFNEYIEEFIFADIIPSNTTAAIADMGNIICNRVKRPLLDHKETKLVKTFDETIKSIASSWNLFSYFPISHYPIGKLYEEVIKANQPIKEPARPKYISRPGLKRVKNS
jgi:hypothetical protein